MKLKGVYTLEATVVISLSFLLFAAGVGVAYDSYYDALATAGYENDFDAAATFRGENC
ncbi:MAG: hypothetical protein K5773_09390 [Pseudobutyrivibrio sp.]|nr:hypothetical protein [Pseudobutyrivibrio sp.]